MKNARVVHCEWTPLLSDETCVDYGQPEIAQSSILSVIFSRPSLVSS